MMITPPSPKMRHPQYALQTAHLPHLLLALFIISYVFYFSWYTINRHNTLNSYAADLSLIDQPMWNTVLGPGYFMELTWGDHQQPRLAEHFEPILIPLSLLFFLWDNVRIILIVQSLALALGALPVFWIARNQLSINHPHLAAWPALAFAVAYLLFPPLQAANIADFHADPLVVTPLLFAFWYALQKRWGWMWFWAIVAMATKETLPTLTAMLGVWLLWTSWQDQKTANHQPLTDSVTTISGRRPMANTMQSGFTHALLLTLVSTLWFAGATYLIVTPLARQYFGTDGPIYFASRYMGGLAGLPLLGQDPARWRYLLGLFAAVGFLPLLAPELLILGLPVLMANLLSNFPGQYSGEQHYSAPLVVAFVLAAIYGTRRLVDRLPLRENGGQSPKITALIAVLLWLLTWSLAYHARHGWTPLSTRTEVYRLTPAAAQVPDLASQIPPEAVVSASAAVHPHLAHRQVIYVFPTVQEADTLLVDVTDIPGVHPNDAHAQLMAMLNADWRLRRAEHGLLLAQRDAAPVSLPPCSAVLPLPYSFYDFARAITVPTYSASLVFGDGRLQLLGYDVHDYPDDGVTFRFYWRSIDRLPDDLRLWPLVYDDTGQLLSDPTQIPMIATIWYPPSVWQPNDVVVTETLPQRLPHRFHLGIAVGPPDSFSDTTQRYPIGHNSGQEIQLYPGHWAQLASFKRQGPFLTHFLPAPTYLPLTPVNIQFGSTIRLSAYWYGAGKLRAGSTLPLLLQWTAKQPLPTDYTVFVHLLAANDMLVAQHDAYPTWLAPQPTSQWWPGKPILDQHLLSLPPDLPPGLYTLQVGLYNAQTMERLLLPDGNNSLSLGQIQLR